MMAVAEKKLIEQGLSERVKLYTGVTDKLPASELYDAATLILVMHFLPDEVLYTHLFTKKNLPHGTFTTDRITFVTRNNMNPGVYHILT